MREIQIIVQAPKSFESLAEIDAVMTPHNQETKGISISREDRIRSKLGLDNRWALPPQMKILSPERRFRRRRGKILRGVKVIDPVEEAIKKRLKKLAEPR